MIKVIFCRLIGDICCDFDCDKGHFPNQNGIKGSVI